MSGFKRQDRLTITRDGELLSAWEVAYVPPPTSPIALRRVAGKSKCEFVLAELNSGMVDADPSQGIEEALHAVAVIYRGTSDRKCMEIARETISHALETESLDGSSLGLAIELILRIAADAPLPMDHTKAGVGK